MLTIMKKNVTDDVPGPRPTAVIGLGTPEPDSFLKGMDPNTKLFRKKT